MDAMLWELLASGSPDDRVEVLIKLSDLATAPTDTIEIVAKIGNVASCRIWRGDIETVRADDAVISMKASRTLGYDPPVEAQSDGRYEIDPDRTRSIHTPFTGKGIAIGIADWGFDFTHPNFIYPDGSSRFLALWDQKHAYDGVNPYGYGKIFYQGDLSNALRSDYPFEVLGYHPGELDFLNQGMHGSHVLGIAGGNGAVGEPGVAPEADIIAVQLATKTFGDMMGLGDSVRVFDAIHFLDHFAGNQPLVINMSVGSHGESHTGKTLLEQAIDHLVTAKMDRAVVQSAGNYFAGRIHTKGKIANGQHVKLAWQIPEQDKTSNELEIWYGSNDQIAVALRAPDGSIVLPKSGLGKAKIIQRNGVVAGRYYHRDREPSTGLHQILLILDKNAPPGTWEVLLFGTQINNGTFQAWIERDMGNAPNQSHFPAFQSNSNTTTGSVCNGLHNICVGAVNPLNDEIGFFSSVGPTWDGRQKPDLAAPGVGILSVKSAAPYQDRSTGELIRKTGTSMAAPYVAGAVALLYQAAERPMSIQEVKARLFKACRPPNGTHTDNLYRYGKGILDVEQLLAEYTVQLSPDQKNHHQPLTLNNMEPNSSNAPAFFQQYHEQFPELKNCNIADLFLTLPDCKKVSIHIGDLVERNYYGTSEAPYYGVVEYVQNDEAWIKTPKGTKKVNTKHSGWEMKRLRPIPILRKKPTAPAAAQEPPEAPEEPETPEVPATPDAPDAPDTDAPAAESYTIAKQHKLVLTRSGRNDNEFSEAVDLAVFSVFNKSLPKEVISGCQVQISGGSLVNAISGATGRNGNLSLDISTLSDGDYDLTVSPANTYSGIVGPATATAATPPDRIWRALQTKISIQNHKVDGITASAPAAVSMSVSSRILNIGLQPVWIKSPNYSPRPQGVTIDTIIVHHTGGAAIGPAINTFLSTSEGTSAHYVIDTNGEIVKMVQDGYMAHHAGFSHWDGQKSVNKFSIGIEIVNRSGAYQEEQYLALISLLQSLVSTLKIPACRIVGHSDIGINKIPPYRLGRKSSDPGLEFDWPRLESAGLGIIIASNPQPLSIFSGFFNMVKDGQLRRGDTDATKQYGGVVRPGLSGIILGMQNELVRIGYFCPQNGIFNEDTERTVMVFQEHFFSGTRKSNAVTMGRVDFSTAEMMINAQTCSQIVTTPSIGGHESINDDRALPEDFSDWDGFPEGDLPQVVQNLSTLRKEAATNQVNTIYKRVSAETGLKHPSLPNNPLIGITGDMVTACYNAHNLHGASTLPEVLLAIWKKEGSDQHNNVVKIGTDGFVADNPDNAKILFRSVVYFIEMGMDQFLHITPVPGKDNEASFGNEDVAAHQIAFSTTMANLIKSKYLISDLTKDIQSSLNVRQLGNGRYEVNPTASFYIHSLRLMDALFRSNADQLGQINEVGADIDLGLTYMHWNLGSSKMAEFIKSANLHRTEAQYLTNDQPVSIVDWAFRRTPLPGEWKQPRENAIKMRYFAEVFGLVFN